jgi:Tol biopolymer transport system component
MTDDRWPKVKALFQAAVERPASERDAFLVAATAGDERVRREVESLLASDVEDDGLLDRLGLPHRIGSYEIVALLGAGAMGEVYRAQDTRLNRDVALKVLPPPFAVDPDRLARFRREAQMLAALNHPNIAAIYGVEDSDGVLALVLELVEGPTLADRLVAGPLPVKAALAAAAQIAEAVEAAHEKGIVHRDLKPANIKIDPSGTVKVLDFGLAKPAVPDGARPDLTGSHDGLILGTASYMSPEQARGQSVDTRGDIWAFGCVLYEMLTGRLAFPGTTVPDTIAKILEREPDWSALPAETPEPVRRLLHRCLVKDPRERLRDIGDARIDLRAVEHERPAVSEPVARAAIPTRRFTPWLPWVALIAVLAAGLGAWGLRRPVAEFDNPLANARFVPLTNWEGAEEGAEISPDGRFVAFLADHDGEFDIWLTQVGTGHFTNLTRDVPPLAPLGAIVRKLGFSDDGAEIWFNPAARRSLMLMPLTGGTPRAFLGPGTNTPAWSPDGSRLVYFGKPPDGDDPMYIADRTGANPRVLVAPQQGLRRNNPAWSPDGRWIYFVSGSEPQDETDINVWRVPAAGGTPEPLTNQHAGVNFVAPIGARTVLYVARAEDGGGPWLWALDVERRSAHRIPSGIDQYTSVAASRDGQRIVATVANPSSTLWRVPLLDRLSDERDAELYPLPAPTGRVLAPRFSSTSLFYLSARGTGDGLWKVQDGQALHIWRNLDGLVSEPPAVSPDGRRLAVVVRQDGKRHLSIMSEDGTNAVMVARSIEIQGAAGQGMVDWSPDGRWIVAGGRDAAGPALFKIPVDGGQPQRLLEGAWVDPVWSPDGNLIVFAGRSLVGQVAIRGVRPGGTAVELPDIRVRPSGYRFLPSGGGLVYVPDIHARDFWLFDFATRQSHQLTRLGNRGTIQTFDITPDGKHIVFDRSRQNSNIVLIDRPRS